ncbi:dimethylhistidine N-methyltransferase [Chryseobacterium sp. Leaf404]|uniref:L-histidine N(alpha)-methyltransferase n=1 Tax=unclassified Chryseobacterium TaxID=2593645 RepID=UPI0006F69078|nr:MULTISPECIES: L-histidine N(alpha)-methyltransferase [unclassified Chryseobacterium]KQT20504.1 dimethylhistidine N-methyltransferase [Chryseobacterium sp. Leaf404]
MSSPCLLATPVEESSAQTFLKDVIKGLSVQPKKLSSKYFYDKNGDHLFQQIMAMPEYYLTQCELDIFKNKTNELANTIDYSTPFDLIELGAGDAMKSSYLLEHLCSLDCDFNYMPIDISGNILSVLQENLSEKIPELNIIPLEGDYFEMLDQATKLSQRRKVVLFLGGNIGNMTKDEAIDFCTELRKRFSPGDLLLTGFDLKKNPHTILAAYNDRTGITAAFNLNLLERMNRELNADFNLTYFEHYQTYDPVSGACRSFLVSLREQTVHIGNHPVTFKENELIDMEISQKFSPEDIQNMAKASRFRIVDEIKDSRGWFVDSVWTV